MAGSGQASTAGKRMECLPNEICWTAGSQVYHRAAFVKPNPRCWWDKGYHRSVCGVVDAATFATFWHFDQGSPYARGAMERKRPCKRCFG